jgi:cardiolipin synthase (CMP-forming)
MHPVWVAHALTLSRIPLAVALWFAWGDAAWSVGLVVLAGLTDAVDGRVARRAIRRGARGPDIGGWLDPVVDKLFVATVLVAAWHHGQPLAVIALIGAREVVLVPLTLVYLARRAPRPPLHADGFGKAATVAQLIALCVMAVAPASALAAAAVAGVVGLAAALHYVVKAVTDDRLQGAGRDTQRS